MALDAENADPTLMQDMAVECVVLDRAGRAKRRYVMPVARLLRVGGAGGPEQAPRDAS